MNKNIILVAGATASGKSRLASYLSKELSIVCVNKDQVKEILVDSLGYKNREENIKLSETSFNLLLGYAEKNMVINKPIILESNFRTQERKPLELLIKKYCYTPLTIFLHADPKVLHKRYIEREHSGNRHIAHVSIDVSDYDAFYEMILPQMEFKVFGRRFNINTTDFGKVRYSLIKDRILKYLN